MSLPLAELIVGEAYNKALRLTSIRDKTPEGRIFVLESDKSTTAQFGARWEVPAIYLEGSDAAIGGWLTNARNKNLHLVRATGWHVCYRYFEVAYRPSAVYALIWWEDEVEAHALDRSVNERQGTDWPLAGEWSGPLMDLGITFLRWRAKCKEESNAVEKQLVDLARTVAISAVVAEEDARALADVERYFEKEEEHG